MKKFDKFPPTTCTCTICDDCDCYSRQRTVELTRRSNRIPCLNSNNNNNSFQNKIEPKISFGCQTELVRKNTSLSNYKLGLIKKPTQSALKTIVNVKENEMSREKYLPCSMNNLFLNKYICFSIYRILKYVKLISLIPIFTIQSIFIFINKTTKWLGAMAVCLIASFLTGTFFFKYLLLTMQIFHPDELIQKISKLKGIECDTDLSLYFIRLHEPFLNKYKIVQIEVSFNSGIQIKYCSLVQNEEQFQSKYFDNIVYLGSKSKYLEKECLKYISEKKIQFSASLNSNELNELKNILNFEENFVHNEISCLAEFQECGPNFLTKTKKMNYNNQMNRNLKHCDCQIKFSTCLTKSFSIKSKKIGHLYFNILKPYCFHYQYRPKCRVHFFGVCLIQGDFRCHINILNYA